MTAAAISPGGMETADVEQLRADINAFFREMGISEERTFFSSNYSGRISSSRSSPDPRKQATDCCPRSGFWDRQRCIPIFHKTAIVLADEPTGNLDSHTSADVLGLLQRTSNELHQTIVMITHNDSIAQLADRIMMQPA